MGAELAAGGVAREGVLTAVVVGLVSQGLSLGELSEALRRLASAAGLPDETLGALIEAADEALSAA